GRLAHGPDEKLGLAGLTAGAVWGISAISSGPPRPMRLALGRDVLGPPIRLGGQGVNTHFGAGEARRGRARDVRDNVPSFFVKRHWYLRDKATSVSIFHTSPRRNTRVDPWPRPAFSPALSRLSGAPPLPS